MAKQQKLGFLGLVLTSFILAGCAGGDTKEETGNEASGSESSASSASTVAIPTGPDEKINEQNVANTVDKRVQGWAEAIKVYYFDFDQAALSADTREALDLVAKVLKATKAKVTLEGHADERGTREYNLALGERRAKAVANYLKVQGVSASQLEVISYGEEKPAVNGTSAADMAKNRRVELVK